MIRRPTNTEWGVLCSWGLLAVAALLMGASTRAWLALLWAMYGNMSWPLLTEIYLSSVHWFWVIPFLSGIVAGIFWRRNQIERIGPFLQVFFHAASIAIFVFSAVAALLPLLTTTFRMQKSTRTGQSAESHAFGTFVTQTAGVGCASETSGDT